jgi:hypothetical protein
MTLDPPTASQSSVWLITAVIELKKQRIKTQMNSELNVKDWVAMFRDIGMDEAKMKQWHSLFEARHPAGHQKFLEWLGLKRDEIDRIRTKSK